MEISERDLGLARVMALRMRVRLPTIDRDDLLSCAYMALLEAIPRWDPARCANRTSYLLHALPRRMIDQLRQERQLQHPGAVHRAPDWLGLENTEAANASTRPVQIDLALAREVREALGQLRGRAAQVLRWRYWQDESPTEIGRRLGVTRGRVSQLERAAVRELRMKLSASV
jgi:RNA polymerase sigma factor (sigma-70 family)